VNQTKVFDKVANANLYAAKVCGSAVLPSQRQRDQTNGHHRDLQHGPVRQECALTQRHQRSSDGQRRSASSLWRLQPHRARLHRPPRIHQSNGTPVPPPLSGCGDQVPAMRMLLLLGSETFTKRQSRGERLREKRDGQSETIAAGQHLQSCPPVSQLPILPAKVRQGGYHHSHGLVEREEEKSGDLTTDPETSIQHAGGERDSPLHLGEELKDDGLPSRHHPPQEHGAKDPARAATHHPARDHGLRGQQVPRPGRSHSDSAVAPQEEQGGQGASGEARHHRSLAFHLGFG